MNISETIRYGIVQVHLDGRFDANTAWQVEQFLREHITKGSKRFVLDLEAVPYIASAGLRVVLALTKELHQQVNGDLRIASLQPTVERIFEISGLNNILRIFDTSEAATQSYLE